MLRKGTWKPLFPHILIMFAWKYSSQLGCGVILKKKKKETKDLWLPKHYYIFSVLELTRPGTEKYSVATQGKILLVLVFTAKKGSIMLIFSSVFFRPYYSDFVWLTFLKIILIYLTLELGAALPFTRRLKASFFCLPLSLSKLSSYWLPLVNKRFEQLCL